MLYIQGNQTKIDTAKNNAGVLNGQNTCFGWDAHFKSNLNVDIAATGFGELAITDITSDSFNLINDTDGIDFPTKSITNGTSKFSSPSDQ